MRTLCDKASNVIDLAELRRRRTMGEFRSPEASGFRPVVLTATLEERRRARRERQAWCLEIGSSLAVILMTAAFTLRMLI